MKKEYKNLEVSVILFDNEDVVTTSGVDALWTGVSSDNDFSYGSIVGSE